MQDIDALKYEKARFVREAEQRVAGLEAVLEEVDAELVQWRERQSVVGDEEMERLSAIVLAALTPPTPAQ